MQLETEKPINSPQSLFVSNTGAPTSSFIITSFPGHEILSINEKRLCTNLRLTPAHYIRFKNDIIAIILYIRLKGKGHRLEIYYPK